MKRTILAMLSVVAAGAIQAETVSVTDGTANDYGRTSGVAIDFDATTGITADWTPDLSTTNIYAVDSVTLYLGAPGTINENLYLGVYTGLDERLGIANAAALGGFLGVSDNAINLSSAPVDTALTWTFSGIAPEVIPEMNPGSGGDILYFVLQTGTTALADLGAEPGASTRPFRRIDGDNGSFSDELSATIHASRNSDVNSGDIVDTRSLEYSAQLHAVGTVTPPEPEPSVGAFVLGIDFNRNDALGAPSQSRCRIISGSTTQASNSFSYTKTIGTHVVAVSQPGSVALEFRGANSDSSRRIPGGDISRAYLVSDFIATREGALEISITGLPSGNYVFRSCHLDPYAGSDLGFAQGSSATTPNTIEARIGGTLMDSVQPTALGLAGLNTTFISDSDVPTLAFSFTHDDSSPLVIALSCTETNAGNAYLLLNGFELFEEAP